MNTTPLKNPNDVRDVVRESYGKVAAGQQNGCCGNDFSITGRAIATLEKSQLIASSGHMWALQALPEASPPSAHDVCQLP
jgi:hypothetical protein